MARAKAKAPGIEMLAEGVEHWPVERLSPYANNARRHSEQQIDKLAEAITIYGWTIPLLVDETGLLIAGHGRLLAAKKLDIKTVPVVVAKGWSEEKRRAYTIADNRLGELSEWDAEILSLNAEMHLDGDYSIDLPDELVVELQAQPEADAGKPKTKRTGAAMENDKSMMMRFGKRQISLNPDELAWLTKKMDAHLQQYGMAMGFVEQTLKACSPADVGEVAEDL
jgi:hypothetical protein